MNQRLKDVLSGQESNYMMPFFWMQDGKHADLRARVAEVAQSGCRAFCVESRTHEDFCGKTWWEDMDILLDEAEKHGMRVWVLDDKHFPTGMANGLIQAKYPQRRKWHLREYHVDVYGPMQGATLFLRKAPEEDEFLGAYAYRRTERGEALTGEWLNVTEKVSAGRLRFDVPEGVWRVFFYYKTRTGVFRGQEYYFHPIDAESVSTLIEAVYEPHWEHYKRYFGNTFAGFFSDEPQLGNDYMDGWSGDRTTRYNRQIGMPGLALPWSDALLKDMQSALDGKATSLLAALWYPMGDIHTKVRYAYMDALTRLWRASFSEQLGKWCEAHGVEYIGHIIEDMNAHARMAYSAGHYFRALDGQHMAGIDVVLHQIVPGFSSCTHTASISGGIADPAFFDNVLAKLAASHAHIQPHMKGRAMCEVFGAYGWAEGAPMMKGLLDHMLVRGINHFVPHAFSPVFPNPDCPPHFGAEGRDPQFSGFTKLMRYGNQVSHLLCGAKHEADVAIVYHAELEWCNGASSMLTQVPAKILYEQQMDFDILPFDALASANVEDGLLRVNEETYKALLVPGCAALPEALLAILQRLENAGLPVWFVEERPKEADFGLVVSQACLAEEAKKFATVHIAPANPLLRVYRAQREADWIYMLVNESTVHCYEGEITVPEARECLKLDLLLDRKSKLRVHDGKVSLSLAPGQSTLLILGADLPQAQEEAPFASRVPFAPEWDIALAKAGHEGEFTPLARSSALADIAEAEEYASFAGWMRYRARFTLSEEEAGKIRALSLGEVGMTARVRVNEKELGERICTPYLFDVSGALIAGENTMEIVVANTLAGAVRDPFSTFLQIPRSGLLGPVEWIY